MNEFLIETDSDQLDDPVSPLGAVARNMPARPGVYIFKDRRGVEIYIGKARSLKHRVISYFRNDDPTDKPSKIVSAAASIDFIITSNELEALLLESTLIKKHKPRYNVLLKDDKGYPFLKITNEEYPILEFARRVRDDGARYFGPYSSAAGVRGTLRFLQRVFPLRFCKEMKKNPCIYYHIEKCPGPCSGKLPPEDYKRHVKAITMFLEGRMDEVITEIEAEMNTAARAMEFEKAAVLRDRLAALRSVVSEKQTMVFTDGKDRDIIAVEVGERIACAEIMFVRRGLLTGHDPFILDNKSGDTHPAVMEAFLKLYYQQASPIPREIIISHDFEDPELMEEFIESRAGHPVDIIVPKRGIKKQMTDTALENARKRLEDEELKDTHDREQRREFTQAITSRVHSKKLVRRIVGFDISTIQGTNTVGSTVCFTDAKPDRAAYRKFIIKGSGRDDFSSMTEMASRYFKRVRDGVEPTPDMVLVDGGKGQVGAVVDGITASGFRGHIPIIGYAKKTGVSHVAGQSTPIVFSDDEPAAILVQRIIAEAHRFAISFHRKRRGDAMVES